MLTSCGGDDSSSPTPTSPDAVFQLLPPGYFEDGYSQTYKFNGSSTVGDKYTATKTVITQAETTYNSQAAIPVKGTFSITNTINHAFATSTSTSYFTTDAANRIRLGSSFSTGGSYTATSLDILPETGKIGDSGDFGTYSGAGAEAEKSMSSSWQLTNANGGLANLIITTHIYNKNNTLASSEETTTVIDTQGNPKSQKIKIYYPSQGATVNLNGKPVN